MKSATSPSPQYKRYVLILLTGVYAFNFIDRQALVILQESIKSDLGLSDTQLGLLTGPAFAFLYVGLGLPIARFADRSNRKNIISAALAIWSGMTVLCGLAQNYSQLFLARMGVGIGEAGCSPPAHAIISDYFGPGKRATALAVYSMGIYIGVLIGFAGAGWIDDHFGWRAAFIIFGLPGIFYALLVYSTLKEPLRGLSDQMKVQASNTKVLDVMRTLWAKRAFRYMALGASFNTFVLYGTGSWFPSLFARVHGMTPTEIGLWSALIAGVGGAVGTVMGGRLADHLGKKDVRWYYRIVIIAMLISVPFYAVFSFTSIKVLAFITLFIPYLLMTFYLAPSIAMTHGMVAANERAFASSILFLLINFIGLGFGPLFVGMVSDWLTPALGDDGLRWAIFACSLSALISVYFYTKGTKYLKSDLIDHTIPNQNENI